MMKMFLRGMGKDMSKHGDFSYDKFYYNLKDGWKWYEYEDIDR